MIPDQAINQTVAQIIPDNNMVVIYKAPEKKDLSSRLQLISSKPSMLSRCLKSSLTRRKALKATSSILLH